MNKLFHDEFSRFNKLKGKRVLKEDYVGWRGVNIRYKLILM